MEIKRSSPAARDFRRIALSPILYVVWGCGIFWFRIFGYGAYCSDSRVNGIPFSERMGISRTLHIGPYRIWGLA